MPGNLIIDIKKVETGIEPVTLADAKNFLNVTSTDDDALITTLCTSCRHAVEQACNISIIAKLITLVADWVKEWELPLGPITGIQSVMIRTGNSGSGIASYETQVSGWGVDGGDFQTFAPAEITSFNPGDPFRGYFQWGPYASTQGACGRRYKIIYTAGYTTVPAQLKQAILSQIAHDYENRGDVDISDMSRNLCLEAEKKAAPYRRDLWF